MATRKARNADMKRFQSQKLPQTILSNLHSLQREDKFTDVTFKVEDEEIKAHKNVLSSTCSYFDTMLQSQLTLGKVIEVSMPKEHFKSVIEFIYTASVKIDGKNASSLLQLSDEMLFDELKDVVSDYFIGELTPSNSMKTYQMSNLYKASRLTQETLNYCASNFHHVLECPEYLELKADEVAKFLGHHAIRTTSEEKILDAAVKWLEFKPDDRIDEFHKVLSALRLHTIGHKYISSTLLAKPFILKSPECLYMLHSAMTCTISTPQFSSNGPSRLPRTELDFAEGIVVFHIDEDKFKAEFYAFNSEGCLKSVKTSQLHRHKGRPINIDTINSWNAYSLNSTSVMLHGASNWHKQINSLFILDTHLMKVFTCASQCSEYQSVQLVEGNQLYAVNYDKGCVSFSRYSVEDDKWDSHKSGNVELPYFSLSHVVLQFSNQSCIYIMISGRCDGNTYQSPKMLQFNTVSKTNQILDVTFSKVLHEMSVVVFMNHAIVFGKTSSSPKQKYGLFVADLNKINTLRDNEALEFVEKSNTAMEMFADEKPIGYHRMRNHEMGNAEMKTPDTKVEVIGNRLIAISITGKVLSANVYDVIRNDKAEWQSAGKINNSSSCMARILRIKKN